MAMTIGKKIIKYWQFHKVQSNTCFRIRILFWNCQRKKHQKDEVLIIETQMRTQSLRTNRNVPRCWYFAQLNPPLAGHLTLLYYGYSILTFSNLDTVLPVSCRKVIYFSVLSWPMYLKQKVPFWNWSLRIGASQLLSWLGHLISELPRWPAEWLGENWEWISILPDQVFLLTLGSWLITVEEIKVLLVACREQYIIRRNIRSQTESWCLKAGE